MSNENTHKENFYDTIDLLEQGVKVSHSAVNHPSHYSQGRSFEPIDVIMDWELDFCLGNATKYLSRAGRKDKNKTIEDLEKAIFYINYEIDMLRGKK